MTANVYDLLIKYIRNEITGLTPISDLSMLSENERQRLVDAMEAQGAFKTVIDLRLARYLKLTKSLSGVAFMTKGEHLYIEENVDPGLLRRAALQDEDEFHPISRKLLAEMWVRHAHGAGELDFNSEEDRKILLLATGANL